MNPDSRLPEAAAGRDERPPRSRTSTFVIAAGGTGGHIFPAVEVAGALQLRGHHCLFVGTERGLESRLIPQYGLPLEFVRIGPLKGVSLGRRLRTLMELPASVTKAWSLLRRTKAAALLSLGGYAAGPLIVAAAVSELPIVILEPNALPGLAHRWAAPLASWALLGFPQAERYFHRGRTEVSGVPIRQAFFEVAPKECKLPLTILITGGSQGSHRLNQAAVEALPRWQSAGLLDRLRFLHQTGEKEHEPVCAAYESHQAQAQVTPFIDDMPGAFAQSDLVVCRAGASAIAELAAAGKASILVPFPFAADQHQLRNAEAMQRTGATRLVLDAEWTGERFAQEIQRLVSDPRHLATMGVAARRQSRPGAAERVAEVLEQMASLDGQPLRLRPSTKRILPPGMPRRSGSGLDRWA